MADLLMGIFWILVAIAAIVTPVAILFFLIISCARYPRPFRAHYITATIWTLTTLIQTAVLVFISTERNLIGHFIVFVAGFVVVASWVQLWERRKDLPHRKHCSLPSRLFVQTLWGPLALWAAVIGIRITGQQAFEGAIARKELPLAFVLQDRGLGDAESDTMRVGLFHAIERQDADAVSAYLAVKTPTAAYYGEGDGDTNQSALMRAVQRDNSMITELLLNYGGDANEYCYCRGSEHLLHLAVKSGQVNQVRTLLRHGAKRAESDNGGNTPLKIAKMQHNKGIIALLTPPPKKQ